MSVPFSQNVNKCLSIASSIADKTHSKEITTVHLLFGMFNCQGCKAGDIIRSLGITHTHFNFYLTANAGISSPNQLRESAELTSCLASSRLLSMKLNLAEVYTEVVLMAIVTDLNSEGYAFLSRYINMNDVIGILKRIYGQIPQNPGDMPFDNDNEDDYAPEFGDIPINPLQSSLFDAIPEMMGQSKKQNEKPRDPKSTLPRELENFGTDFTQRARDGKIDPVIGRDFEIQRLIEILCRKTKNNPVLIGEPGVGKSAIAEGLALRIVNNDVPEQLSNKTIFSLEMGNLMAGTKYRGELEERLKKAIDVLSKSKDIIVFIDEFHTLVRAGSRDGEVSPSDMLKPYLARGEIQTIGATTTDEYRKFVEEDKALERRFQPIIVNPPTIEQTIEILKGIRSKYEEFHKIKIKDDALVAAANLSDRYISDRYLPDKAIDLIDEASSRAKINVGAMPPEIKELEGKYNEALKGMNDAAAKQDYGKADEYKKTRDSIKAELDAKTDEWNKKTGKAMEVGSEEIAEVISRWTKIPVTKLTETDLEKLNNLEKILHERVVGQNEAVENVAKAIRRSRAGLHDPNRPIGTFLFLGPTGVGKTELSKAVAEAMFDSEDNIIRIDMSEYMEAHSVSKLIGSPPGYVGFDDGGQLTEQVRRRPYSVVLFDEIEKAHPDVYNILLQILDEGRLTDSKGRTVNFKNSIIIMTSNVGIANLKKQSLMGFGEVTDSSQDKDKEILQSALKSHFKPEFLNRIDVICYFNRLKEEDIRSIADILFKKVTDRLKDKNISVRLTSEVVDYIIKNGYDVEYGARPLKRLIEQSIEDTLAEAILSGKIKENGVATLEMEGEKVVVT